MDYKQIKTTLLEQIPKVGEFINQERLKFTEDRVQIKSKNSLVSYVDTEAEKMLVKQCQSLIPASDFINEESGSTHQDHDHRWIIDPLDGTTNFIHGIPAYSISLALQYKEETVLGIIYEINQKELFSADQDGAFLNGKAIKVSQHPNLESSLLATGFPYCVFEKVDFYLSILKCFMHNTRGLRRIGSAALDLAYTACGRFDGFFELGLSPWDVAAGAYIVQQAGGYVTDFKGKSNYLFGKEIVASSPNIHAEMLKIIADN